MWFKTDGNVYYYWLHNHEYWVGASGSELMLVKMLYRVQLKDIVHAET